MLEDAERWRAPGALEDVRRLLNTWDYAARTGHVVDRLPPLAAKATQWRQRFGDIPPPAPADVQGVIALRDGLRVCVEDGLDAAWLNAELKSVAMGVAVVRGATPTLRFEPAAKIGARGAVLATVVAAIGDGTWSRLKACPDCRLVFFDHSRNASKRWCQMSAHGGGRACGSIAKVRAWRARKGSPA
jgi:predicted RNA-binding Zn ribbon-like protein